MYCLAKVYNWLTSEYYRYRDKPACKVYSPPSYVPAQVVTTPIGGYAVYPDPGATRRKYRHTALANITSSGMRTASTYITSSRSSTDTSSILLNPIRYTAISGASHTCTALPHRRPPIIVLGAHTGAPNNSYVRTNISKSTRRIQGKRQECVPRNSHKP